jgi:hypothetical protein
LQKVVALFRRFTAVLIGDGSAIALPDELADLFAGCCGGKGASRAASKLQALWDLETVRLARLRVAPGKASDTRSPIAQAEARPGEPLVFDLGYFDLDRSRAVDAREARFVSWLLFGTEVHDPNGEPLDLLASLRRQPTGLLDQVILLGVAARPCSRLVATSRLGEGVQEGATADGGMPGTAGVVVVRDQL